ncbi:MAG: helix-turn-helix domain-containing protein [Clostridia bacterium]
MELYEKIRNIRERQEIKQKEMARYLHMQPTTYNAYENGKRAITADILKNICLILKVSSDELLEINIKKPYNDLNDENSLILEKIKRGLLTIQKSEKNA